MPLSHVQVTDAVERSQAAINASVRGLSERDAHAPSLLPDWTRGHLITHVCRNADAITRITRSVLGGPAQTEMYPGGQEARNSAIEDGAERPVALLAADLEYCGARAIAELRRLTDAALSVEIPWRRPVTAASLPLMRWRELEIHHVDLGTGYTVDDWDPAFVEETLEAELPLLSERAPGVEVPDLPPSQMLAWLIGRPQSDDLPQLPAWP
ncbi:maleylpyruvate isomerase [Antricoccus suffuscus]|uniref:Maleylpyruvate isomerase n=1 Tax=Antricoccus suffuscus TaxID=1629062 RepID=A0A2T0ZWM2_9ACTN|nr:maleylpyruvate isomerase family mycothiol-dependent enzyme [Antricoccus suffuscus]PRZ40746.1 maleylpyruvate isomerase [Antricoccus suffuscus]